MAKYLALGDSMSIDDYTGQVGGGAVKRFFRSLGGNWTLDDNTFDRYTIEEVPKNKKGDLITLTIGGNDILMDLSKFNIEAVERIREDHYNLLKTIRENNPHSCFIVGNIYMLDLPMSEKAHLNFDRLNRRIGDNTKKVEGNLADIRGAFEGNEARYITQKIEPSFEGAGAIAELFKEQYQEWQKKE